MSASSTEKIKPIAQIIRDFRKHPEELTEDDRDIIVIALETVWDLMKYEKTANWKAQPAKPGYFTPGGNSVTSATPAGTCTEPTRSSHLRRSARSAAAL